MSQKDFHIQYETALEKLNNHNSPFINLFRHGSLEVELYKPQTVDLQQPHDRDEIYVIASGESEFNLEGEIVVVKTGDFLFVPAGKEHRFINFSEDFSTWVFFYGPVGGEEEN